jgi:hypothetical protein
MNEQAMAPQSGQALTASVRGAAPDKPISFSVAFINRSSQRSVRSVNHEMEEEIDLPFSI